MSYSSRRSVLTLAGLSLLGTLTACRTSAPTDAPPSADPTTTAGNAFPVEIKHRFGTTTVPAAPKRVVALGGGDMESLISLGMAPVGGADWFGLTDQLRPWVADDLTLTNTLTLLKPNPPNFEEIAELAPDLILYVNSTNDQNVYNTLAAMTNTLAGPAEVRNAYGVPWQDQLKIIATAVGRQDKVEGVLAKTEKSVADVRAKHLEFEGKTITAGVFTSGQMSVWMPSDPRMQLLADLGFTPNPAVAKLDTGDFFVALSAEQLGLMEADVLLIAALGGNGKVVPEVQNDKVFQNLAAVKSGHVAYFPGPASILTTTPAGNFSSSFSIGGPLGIPACLDELTRLLTAAVAGA